MSAPEPKPPGPPGPVGHPRAVWRTAGGDPARRALFDGPAGTLADPTSWFRAAGPVQASPVFDHAGRSYVADLSGSVQSHSATGEHRWTTRLNAAISASPVLDPTDERLFVGTHDGTVAALDTARGTLAWRRSLPSHTDPRILADPLFLPGSKAVLFSSWGGRGWLLNAADGEPVTDWNAGAFPRAAPAADARDVVFFLRAVPERGVEWVRRHPGGDEEVLHLEPDPPQGATPGRLTAGPLLDEGRSVAYGVLPLGATARLLAWDLDADRVRWTRDLPAAVHAPPGLLPGGHLVVADLAGHVHRIDPDGGIRFSVSLECDYLLAGGVCPGDDRWILGDPLGRLNEIRSDGSLHRRFLAPRAIQGRPAIDPSGNVLVPCMDGTVYRLANQTA
ncbi:MAG: PQQ-binding-like beta-propeller repeat protein [Verrucomicrobiae bacterium]|nr:PQQ-binding-like beta-propeller repeat protein [Verrucomicrobiae bacterium]